MRKLWLLMNTSLNGYFEAPGHDISWSTRANEAFSVEGSSKVDALLFGHRTYDMMKAFWPTPAAAELEPDVAKFMTATQKYVVSHEPFEPGWENVTVLSGDALANVRALKEQDGASIGIFGSNTLCVDLLREGLLDEIQVVVNPVVIGNGSTLFAGLPKWVRLTLTESRAFSTGVVLLSYAVGSR